MRLHKARGFARLALVCAGLAAVLFPSPASAKDQKTDALAAMSLEELLQVEITSAGKKEQLITDTAAAVYVITSDDIRRAHATTIMDLLRQVPGALVARAKARENGPSASADSTTSTPTSCWF